MGDIEIARSVELERITKIARKVNIDEDDLELYGKYKAKISDSVYSKTKNNPDGKLILVTAHRRENLGEPMRRIFKAIRRIVDEYPDVKVIYPVHLNPRVQEVANEVLGDSDKIRLIEPLDVLDFHNYMERAYFIMSDSGGVQEEAPSLGKPVLVLRNTTERPEGIEAGTLKLVGTETEDVYVAAKELLDNEEAYREMSEAKNPYGDGFASKYIVDAIMEEK